MLVLKLLPVCLCLAQWSAAAAVPPTNGSGTCTNPPKRMEWRQLSETQRKSYTEAVLCLTPVKAGSPLNGTVNRFDEFQAVHKEQTPYIHIVGQFLLWHRYFLATYEKALKDECGWTLGQPFSKLFCRYWDWSLDAEPLNETSARIFDSAIFNPDTGFGGNGYPKVAPPEMNPQNLTGNTGGGCVMNGPFAPPNFMLNLPTPHCLVRDFMPWIIKRLAAPKLVEEALAQPDYFSFAKTVENWPKPRLSSIHSSGHSGVGGIQGTMADAEESPGDPLFYCHHGNIDRIFWQWQQKDLTARLNEVGGPIKPFDYSGKNVTLDFEVNIGPLAGNATIKHLLNTEGGTLCYTY
ncbi:hypothetical protein HBI71_036640 [Parastagonospora nodorum]|nr:hypothetical protein HBI71_036640 [Parastagonospora nodorum]